MAGALATLLLVPAVASGATFAPATSRLSGMTFSSIASERP
jgi:hypothetical protein